MVYVLCCSISVGNAKFEGVHGLTIKNSTKQLSDECVIEVPTNFVQEAGGKRLQDVIKEGQPVEVKLGYSGELFTEFKGYIKSLKYDTPFRIECEDEMYVLRQKKAVSGTFENIDLSTFLKKQGLNAQLGFSLKMGKFVVAKGTSLYALLFALKKDPYNLYSYYDGDTLRIGFAYDVHRQVGIKRYTIGENVAKNSLEYISEDGRFVKVKAISHQKDGKKTVVEIGDSDGTLRTLNCPTNLSSSELKTFAEAELKRMKFSGYEGKITGFGYPRVRAGDTLLIQDKKYPERAGKYLADAVEITYGDEGYRRQVSVSTKISS